MHVETITLCFVLTFVSIHNMMTHDIFKDDESNVMHKKYGTWKNNRHFGLWVSSLKRINELLASNNAQKHIKVMFFPIFRFSAYNLQMSCKK